MNRHPGLFSLALLSGIVTLTLTARVADVRGQTPPAGGTVNIDALKNATSVAAATPQIAAYIKGQVEKLTSDDPAAAAAAREALIDAATGAKPSFLSAFADQLDAAIAPALKHESDLVRLNAAIAVARVAEPADSAALQDATITLLNDKSPFVVLWGLKAAGGVLPAVLRNPAIKPDPLLNAIVKAAAAHGTGAIGAPIAVEAYEALTLNLFDRASARPAPAALRAVIPVVQQLLQQRAQMYAKSIPPEPLAESRATLFLVDSGVWKEHDAKQKLASVQVMSDIIALAAAQQAQATPVQAESLREMIGLVSKAIAVVPESKPAANALEPATKVNARSSPEQVTEAVNAVVPALKKTPAFGEINAPPTVASDGGSVAPSTGPATSAAFTATGSTAAAASISP